jgi:ribulose-bisphosphate carboxylase large chain
MTETDQHENAGDRFFVTYLITGTGGKRIEDIAADIAIEQTVEAPSEVIPSSHWEMGIIGRVERIEPVSGQDGAYDVSISFRCDITGFSLPQFFNVLFGNISLKDNIRIIDVGPDEALARIAHGPRHGMQGIREALGIFGRPLTMTALKPMGASVRRLSEMAFAFAKGGIDLIKDDHGLADQRFHPFEDRVAACQEAVARANGRTGGSTLYFPMVNGTFDAIERQARFAVSQGIRGVVLAPMLSGLDVMRFLSETYNLIMVGHPALAGAYVTNQVHGIAPGVFLGTLFRLMGADASVFPDAGGRFVLTEAQCRDIAYRLVRPMAGVLPSFPCPGGGMRLDKIEDVCEFYGVDSILLIGGALMRHSPDLVASTQVFLEKIRSVYGEIKKQPREFVSSCEYKGGSRSPSPEARLAFNGYRWGAKQVEDYKPQAGAGVDFAGVTRQELVGASGERTSFDLRYFEIAPKGFSSREKHGHEHVIIGVRGKGICVKGSQELPIGVNDIVYIGPHETHQLKNEGTGPFGFYCIVDHTRDRPLKV